MFIGTLVQISRLINLDAYYKTHNCDIQLPVPSFTSPISYDENSKENGLQLAMRPYQFEKVTKNGEGSIKGKNIYYEPAFKPLTIRDNEINQSNPEH